jgi:hypothetical protein
MNNSEPAFYGCFGRESLPTLTGSLERSIAPQIFFLSHDCVLLKFHIPQLGGIEIVAKRATHRKHKR